MLKRLTIVIALVAVSGTQWACAPLAAGVAGAAVGHEVAERKHKDRDRD
jgi:hypothetical protein